MKRGIYDVAGNASEDHFDSSPLPSAVVARSEPPHHLLTARLAICVVAAAVVNSCSMVALAENAGSGDAAIATFVRMVEAVEAAQNQFEHVRARGVMTIQSRVLSGRAGSASRGEASNSDVSYSFEFLSKDFGLYRRIVSTPSAGASDGYNYETRVVQTPNYMLDADDLSHGYVRPARQGPLEIGDLIGAFWDAQDRPSASVPTKDASSKWNLRPASSGRIRLEAAWNPTVSEVYEIDAATALPLLHDVSENGASVDRCEWEWVELGESHYPRRVSTRDRITYPGGAEELLTIDLEFELVERLSSVSDDEFRFSALGLKPGTIVTDMRDPAQPRYEFQPTSGAVDGLVKLAPPPGATPVPSDLTRNWGVWIVFANLMAGLFLAGLYIRSKCARRANP